MKELYVKIENGYHEEVARLGYSYGFSWMTGDDDYFPNYLYYVFSKTILPGCHYNICTSNKIAKDFNTSTQYLLFYPQDKKQIIDCLMEFKAPLEESIELELIKITKEIYGTKED